MEPASGANNVIEHSNVVKAFRAMSEKQKKLFYYLLCNSDEGPVKKSVLLSDVWKISFDPQTNLIDVAAYRLRNHLKNYNVPLTIKNYRARGLRLETHLAESVPKREELSQLLKPGSGVSPTPGQIKHGVSMPASLPH